MNIIIQCGMLENLSLQNNGIPIYVQLRDQLAALVGRGALAPGARLPTMREVAVALRIDLNTVHLLLPRAMKIIRVHEVTLPNCHRGAWFRGRQPSRELRRPS